MRYVAILCVAASLAAEKPFEMISTKQITESGKAALGSFSQDGKEFVYRSGKDIFLLQVATGALTRLSASDRSAVSFSTTRRFGRDVRTTSGAENSG